ncbi:hypothetical protein [Desulfosarcina sp.]|uniref:hypothetical protein n=1 Tax=Desulfosarcina sp. TaxID=2027861 RepID=UPI00397074B2
MKNKMLYFILAFATVAIIELFPLEIAFTALQDQTNGLAGDTLTASKNDVQAWDAGPGINQEVSAQSSEGAGSMATASFLDSVTILLLGTGLIGLAGLGRKKT